MSDQTQDKTLSEIGHLFLSSIRTKASNGSAPPKRIGPNQRRDFDPDLTPEELAGVFIDDKPAPIPDEIPQVTAVIASHLTDKQLARVREYARHLTGEGARIGMIELDACEFRLTRFDAEGEPSSSDTNDAVTTESLDPRRMTETLAELNADVDRWLLFVPAPRTPEARTILRQAKSWVALCACDHDGVVACYRNLKGLSDLWPAESSRPQLSLALLDAVDDDHAQRISEKLTTVCAQFLSWPVETEGSVRPDVQAAEQLILHCRPLHDKTQIASGPQWQIVTDFLAKAPTVATPAPARDRAPARTEARAESPTQPLSDQKKWARRLIPSESTKRLIAEVVVPTPKSDDAPPLRIAAPEVHPTDPPKLSITRDADVIEIPEHASESSILSAILHARATDLVECPLTPPVSSARLAVNRQGRLTLLAVARQGLAELTPIAEAFRWLTENRNLISMAIPQLAINPQHAPSLTLLVDQSDAPATKLRPMLHSPNVTLHTYRTLRFSGKRGLLLEAA